MSYYDTSYPPSLYGLPSSHDLQLVGIPQPGTLIVDFTVDSDGKSARIAFGDGNSVTTATGIAQHTYAAHQIYTATATSGNASDSAVLDLTVTGAADDEPEPEPETENEPESFRAVKVEELPEEIE
jgi:PKD repeat protein